MPNSGDVVDLELALPEGRAAGVRHPAVLVTSQRILDAGPSVVHVIPLTTTMRPFHSEIVIAPDETNRLDEVSAAQCRHLRAISPGRIVAVRGNVAAVVLAQLRETIAVILDCPHPPTRASGGRVVERRRVRNSDGRSEWGGWGRLRIMGDWRADRIGSAIRGENPTVITHMPASFAVMGDPQWLPGYCVLLVDEVGIDRLSDLPVTRRAEFLSSMERLGEAVQLACAQADSAFRRVNLEILGNADPFLHAHVWPRYDWEPLELVQRPVWLYPPERWADPSTALGPRHDELRRAIGAHLLRVEDLAPLE